MLVSFSLSEPVAVVVDTEGPLRVAGLLPAYCRALLLVDGVNIATCKNMLGLTRR